MEIVNRTEATMDATLTTRTAVDRQQGRNLGLRLTAGRTLRRLQRAIVSGSDHPCWRQLDAATTMSLLPAREQDRLLNGGRTSAHR